MYILGLCSYSRQPANPFTFSAQLVLIYNNVETNIQGRVFAVRNAMNYTAIMLGILLGGAISEYIFEPFIRGSFGLAAFLRLLVGDTKGSGMALMFICTGIIGAISCLLFINNRHIKKLMK